MLTKETAKGHVGLTSTICRNFEFYQNDTKIRRKLAYEMYKRVQLLGGFTPPDPLTRGSATGPRWGHSTQTPIIASRYRARHSPQMPKPHSAYGSVQGLTTLPADPAMRGGGEGSRGPIAAGKKKF